MLVKYTKVLPILLVFFASGCFAYSNRESALIEGIDIDQSLEVARYEMEDNKFSTVLALWALRDQHMDAGQAAVISALYFEHIDRIDSDEQKSRSFSVWHLTWAVSNMYRLNDDTVKAQLQSAYDDAAIRVEQLDRRVATKHFEDDEIFMGDIHLGGRAYAKSHLVVPGNDSYLQSVEEYLAEREED